jgi:hypothetical protein
VLKTSHRQFDSWSGENLGRMHSDVHFGKEM